MEGEMKKSEMFAQCGTGLKVGMVLIGEKKDNENDRCDMVKILEITDKDIIVNPIVNGVVLTDEITCDKNVIIESWNSNKIRIQE